MECVLHIPIFRGFLFKTWGEECNLCEGIEKLPLVRYFITFRGRLVTV